MYNKNRARNKGVSIQNKMYTSKPKEICQKKTLSTCADFFFLNVYKQINGKYIVTSAAFYLL